MFAFKSLVTGACAHSNARKVGESCHVPLSFHPTSNGILREIEPPWDMLLNQSWSKEGFVSTTLQHKNVVGQL
jgi:hypothetical protein